MKTLLSTAASIFLLVSGSAQNVGVGTTTPRARLHVADSAVLFSGSLSATLPANPGLLPASGSGVRMMWLPTRGAFRAGGVGTTQWNDANIGNYSAAFGQNNVAKGDYSFAAGSANFAGGHAGIAMGGSNDAKGQYSVALGYNATATAYGSVVVGRYNVIAGTTDSWVNSDPLFVVGNGYLEEISPGIMQVVRRNALTVNKTGVATFHNELRTDDNLRVAGIGVFDKTINLKDGLIALGTGSFHKNLYVTGKVGVDTIENLKVMNAEYTNGTNPEVNLVPLGVVEFKASFSTSLLNNTPTTTYKNLAANFVTSVVGIYDQGRLEEDAVVGISLVFNASRVGDYKEIIAVGHSRFDGIGFSGNANLSASGTMVKKDANGKPISCEISFEASELPEIGGFATYGTYMFYGLK